MVKKHIKKIIATSAGVLAACVILILSAESLSFANGSVFTAVNQTTTIFDGDADYGVLLLSDNYQKDAALIDAFQSVSVPVMHSRHDVDSNTVANIKDLIAAMTTEFEISADRIAVVATHDYAKGALLRALEVNDVLGTVVVEPTVDIDELIKNGVFSCALQRSPVLVAGHSWDSENFDESYVELYNLLSADQIDYNGRPLYAEHNEISIILSPIPITSTAMISNELVHSVINWVSESVGEVITIPILIREVKPILWFLSLLSLVVLLSAIAPQCRSFYSEASGVVSAEVNSRWIFFLSRAVIWVASLPLMLAIWLILYFLRVPLGQPGLIFTSYLLAATLTTGFLYSRGMVGVKGVPTDIQPVLTFKSVALSVALLIGVFAIGAVLGYSAMWGFDFSLQRHIFALIMIPVLTVGFICMMKDGYMLELAIKNDFVITFMMLIPYLPLVALAIFFVPMGMIPVAILIGKLLVWLIISILTAKIIKDLTGGVLIAAISGAVCFSPFLAYQIYI